MKRTEASDRYDYHRSAASELLCKIGAALEDMDDRLESETCNWEHVGDVQHVASILQHALDVLRGEES